MSKVLMLSSVVLAGFAAFGSPQPNIPDVSAGDMIAARQASLDMSSLTFRSMTDAMKSGRDAKSQAYPAAALAKWARVLPGMFPPGTGKGETSVETQARSSIWRDRAGFARAAAAYAEAAGRLGCPGCSQ